MSLSMTKEIDKKEFIELCRKGYYDVDTVFSDADLLAIYHEMEILYAGVPAVDRWDGNINALLHRISPYTFSDLVPVFSEFLQLEEVEEGEPDEEELFIEALREHLVVVKTSDIYLVWDSLLD